MSSSVAVEPVTGWQGDENYFRFEEYDGYQPRAVLDVLDGKIAGVIFRGMVPEQVCEEVRQRFWRSPQRQTRGVEAPGYYLGAYTWNKPTDQYLAESAAVNPVLEEVLDLPGNPMKVFYDGLRTALSERGGTVRPAERNGQRACIALFRSWHATGDYALAAHDDDSQCSDPQMADFERNEVFGRPIAALNICLENEGAGGRLVYWNIQPDIESKRRLGIEYTGSPYPLETLWPIEAKWVEVRTGDVYVFNGAHVHAVESNFDGYGTRTTLAAMLGHLGAHDIITWS